MGLLGLNCLNLTYLGPIMTKLTLGKIDLTMKRTSIYLTKQQTFNKNGLL